MQATAKQVRDEYRRRGYQARIRKDGRITFRHFVGGASERMWREGRWISEYIIVDGKVVLR